MLEIDLHGTQHFDRNAFVQQAYSAQKVLHGDAVMVRPLRFLLRQTERLARPGGKPLQRGIDFFLFRHIFLLPAIAFSGCLQKVRDASPRPVLRFLPASGSNESARDGMKSPILMTFDPIRGGIPCGKRQAYFVMK